MRNSVRVLIFTSRKSISLSLFYYKLFYVFFQIIIKSLNVNLISASIMKLCRIKNSFCRIFSAHHRSFIINRTFSVWGYQFTSKYKVPLLIFAFYIKPSVCWKKKLHYFKFFFGICVNTIHIVTAFAALFTFTRNFINYLFGYKIGPDFIDNAAQKIKHN